MSIQSEYKVNINVNNVFNICDNMSELENKNMFVKNFDDELVLYSYRKCTETDPSYIKKNRGTVYSKKDMKVVAPTFGYTCDYVEGQDNDKIKSFDVKNMTFFESREGTLLKLFFYAEKWYLSTHRKLDAFKSRWNSSFSFGKMFQKGLCETLFDTEEYKENGECGEEVYKKFTEKLDKNNIYFFLNCSNKDTKVVSEIYTDKQLIYHVGTIVRHGDESTFTFDVDIGIKKPKQLSFQTPEELLEHVYNIDTTISQGVFCLDNNFNSYKVINKKYIDIFNKKVSEYKLKYRYLEVRNDKDLKHEFLQEHRDNRDFFTNIETNIFNLCNEIKKCYIRRHIKKENFYTNKEIHHILKECHEWHKQDFKNNIVKINVVVDFVNKAKPYYLIKMI